jgi:hypothetical protein
MNTELITSVAIGIGLAASAGFRVFVPMLWLQMILTGTRGVLLYLPA